MRAGIYELRATNNGVNYRVLYFFHGREAVVLTQLITKESGVPYREIERAIARRDKFTADPERHTFEGWTEGELIG